MPLIAPPPPDYTYAPDRPSLKLHCNDAPDRRKIRMIEFNAKCRYLKKLTCKGTLRQVFYLSETPSPPMTTYSPPPYSTGKGGGS